MIILGLNPGFDSTACLLVDGEIRAIVEEERLSRVKMHLGFPRRAIRRVLDLSDVEPSDVDCVTFSFVDYLGAHPVVTRLLLQETGFPFDPENVLKATKLLQSLVKVATPRDYLTAPLLRSQRLHFVQNTQTYLAELKMLGIDVPDLVPVDHHEAHAASAYYSSGFDDCLIVTADGCGDGHSLTVSIGANGAISRIRSSPENASAGFFYSSITAFLGFRAHRHEGKITGLAAYGDPSNCYELLRPCLGLTPDKQSFTSAFVNETRMGNLKHLPRLVDHRFYRRPLMNRLDAYYRSRLSSFSREDIAAAAQRRLEDVFIEYLQPLVVETGLRKLALAGGVFANVRLNQRLYELPGVDEIFIHPNMGDGGNALGSALLAHANHSSSNGRPSARRVKLQHVYFGPAFSDADIENELKRRGLRYRYCDNIEADIAEKVARFAVVGRFNGRMEYGPRALGNRSILANPTDEGINANLNARLRRTEFMPFAPSVLEEDARVYFDLSDGNLHAAEFMTITCDIRPEQRKLLPAVCHVDGTARPHIVREAINPSFHRILREFKQRTGLGVIINTSFNIHEEPIVCTPADACKAFEQNSVDALAIGNFLVE
jgi:carbamoyltransferase